MTGLLSKRDFLQAVRRMDPYEFEQFLSDVWEKRGYETVVRSKSGDRGIDIVASQGETKVLLQAKRYSTSNKVGSEEIRKYATLYQQDSEADLVVIVTTSSFTTDGRKLAQDLNVDTIDGVDLFEIVNTHGPEIAIDYLSKPAPNAQHEGETTTTKQEPGAASPFDSPSSFIEIREDHDITHLCPECGKSTVWKGKKRKGIIYTLLKCSSCGVTWAYEGPWPDRGPSREKGWTQISDENSLERKDPNGAGCFIATAAYGTPKAQEIDYLRDFRDDVLLESRLGILFVEAYYKYSPPIADWVAKNAWRKRAVRTLIIEPALRFTRPFV